MDQGYVISSLTQDRLASSSSGWRLNPLCFLRRAPRTKPGLSIILSRCFLMKQHLSRGTQRRTGEGREQHTSSQRTTDSLVGLLNSETRKTHAVFVSAQKLCFSKSWVPCYIANQGYFVTLTCNICKLFHYISLFHSHKMRLTSTVPLNLLKLVDSSPVTFRLRLSQPDAGRLPQRWWRLPRGQLTKAQPLLLPPTVFAL